MDPNQLGDARALRPVQSFWPKGDTETTVYLDDLFAPGLLTEMIAAGYVKVQQHPSQPLSIYNYSETCAYERVWNDVTRQCRGLIVREDGVVLGRPFPKFFNYGEPEAAELDLAAPAVVTDKLDGSLGILYPSLFRDVWAIATRGSFGSDQARHANLVWLDKYHNRFDLPVGVTLLFEIVYPGNRIVLDYGDLDDLVLLGGVHIATGRSLGPEQFPEWPGPRAETFGYASLGDALGAAPRLNAEGMVVHLLDTDQRVKIKQEDYVRLHRIITGLNARVVWEHLAAGLPIAELIEPLPDEFHAWALDIADDLAARVKTTAADVEAVYSGTVNGLAPGWGRKDYALAVKDHPLKSALFMRLDGRDYMPLLWRQVEPRGDVRPSNAPVEENE